MVGHAATMGDYVRGSSFGSFTLGFIDGWFNALFCGNSYSGQPRSSRENRIHTAFRLKQIRRNT
jgi:hypothetical protein